MPLAAALREKPGGDKQIYQISGQDGRQVIKKKIKGPGLGRMGQCNLA